MLLAGLIAGSVGGEIAYYARDLLPRPEGLGAMPPYPPETLAAARRVAMEMPPSDSG